MSLRRREADPWAGRGGYTTLNKDSKVVWEPGLPAQCISRRQHTTRKPNPDELERDVSVDLKSTLKLAPDAKAEWLPKALMAIKKSHVKALDVFDIVTHPRFIAGVGNRHGQSMLRSVTDNILVFSEKQREAFTKSKLFQEFAVQSQRQQGDQSSDDEAKRSRKKSRSRGGSHSRSRSASRERRRSTSREEDKRRPHSSSHAASAPSSGALQGGPEEAAKQVSAEQDAIREEDRQKADAERQLAKDREMQRRAKLGSAFLVDDEDEEEDAPQMQMEAKRAQERAREERAGALMPVDYSRSNGGPRDEAPPEAAHFVESMGGGSVLHQAHLMLLQKAGGEMRSPSIVRKDRNRSRSRRKRRTSRSRSRSNRGRPGRAPDRRGGAPAAASGSYRSPTPDGRARGQARAARKAKMIASMLGVQIPRR